MEKVEIELLRRLEAEVRKLTGSQGSVALLGVIKEINDYRRKRAQIEAAQPKVKKWAP